jgi:hypothetical protein
MAGTCVSQQSYGEETPTSDTSTNTNSNDSTTDGETLPTEDETAAIPASMRVVPYPDANRHRSVLSYLSLHQRDNEAIMLVAGERSFYGLYLPERNGKAQGGILILHDIDQHGQWPTLITPLREQLPDYGWNTLAIEMPMTPSPAIQPRSEYSAPSTETTAAIDDQNSDDSASESPATSATDTTANPQIKPDPIDSAGISKSDALDTTPQDLAAENNAPLPRLERLPALPQSATPVEDDATTEPSADDRYRQQVREQIQAGINFLNQRGQLNIVVIASGESAPWAADYVQQQQRDSNNAKGITLIMVDAREHRLSPIRLNQRLESLDIPMLDLVTADSRETPFQLQQRAGAMAHKHMRKYQQIILPTSANNSDLATRRIRGWLKTHAAGTEISSR